MGIGWADYGVSDIPSATHPGAGMTWEYGGRLSSFAITFYVVLD
jgi:hypothetical protein